MSTSIQVQTILNSMIQSLKTVLPNDVHVSAPSISKEPYEQSEIGVLIGMVGDLKGRIIIDSSPETFSTISEAMFGMKLEGEMLESFTGEFGNMIAGNLCTYVAAQQLVLDITPPTVMVGHTKLLGYNQAIILPVEIDAIGKLTILLAMDPS
ncbi:chemotaxis protein CheX [Rummeliibacillus sp. G93]|uniref:chemotaxis protein CheX n=1 Tax=Rummeliibacillus TaxID=648802 RepID=UPI001168B30B|nr:MULTISPECIES: chemotaxis protein CheX [Rummeliibacillus]MBB5168917.1 chemotaxis protein CheX [Rummeliibacillus stabekisii]UQW96317.1 chemotaxis protein CheX [Rummeliibacillus sp. G93]GEL04938.1 CheY-P phosphatase CheX [Rummeliibacillus stabekisii]